MSEKYYAGDINPCSFTSFRSSSVVHDNKTNLLTVEDAVHRRHSMPSNPSHLSLSFNDIHRTVDKGCGEVAMVRSFKMTPKGPVNKGDTLRKRWSGPSVWTGCAVSCDSQEVIPATISVPSINRPRTPSTTSQDSGTISSSTSSAAPSYFRILLVGSPGVGKTLLTKHFMSSENVFTSDENAASEAAVSIVLDGEESIMEFCSMFTDTLPSEDINVDAYVVVFSITDRESFSRSLILLHHLRNDLGTDRSIVLVANKTDLVRNRMVSGAARSAASCYKCKYIETSATLNHNVDELLVGTLSQIRLKLNPDAIFENFSKNHQKERKGSIKIVRNVLNKLLNRQKSLSCDNLYEL
ncbi:hypothetical protein CHS0354_029785 [Potamilus streckersoni]|uniref:GTP-binding protein REM 1 n=1 Tax=Potamilus streckersoni TaxID=2493646 RepID=A0AAE0TH97_9BIVA|nr:hypothetical protein CHS0354_029785 [Potamilus streckersoni]